MGEVTKLSMLVTRNTKAYFKDKFLFFTSMLTPLILLILFFAFLKNIYIDSFKAFFPQGIAVDDKILNGIAGAWLLSSVLSVSSVTVAICANMVMVDDKISGAINDFKVSPVKSTTISISYFVSNFFILSLVIFGTLLVGCIYLAIVGWYISVSQFFMILLGCLCNILFGSLLSCIVLTFVNSQGMQSAVATLVSALYGFLCGAYMPISSFAEGLQNFLGLLPGTYGTAIMRNYCMQGYLDAISNLGVPPEAIKGIRDGFDANIYVFGSSVSLGGMFGILLGTSAVLLLAYVAIVILQNKNIAIGIGRIKAAKNKKTD